jgi:alkylated DNA repair dioxygenase AlkB
MLMMCGGGECVSVFYTLNDILKISGLMLGIKDSHYFGNAVNAHMYFHHLRAPKEVIPEFDSLWNLKPQHKEQRMMFGKLVTIPRFVSNFGQPYRFSGKTMPAEPVPAILQPVIDYANERYSDGGTFTEILVNYYESGNDSISMHSDDEKCIKKHSPILSLSLGEERMFVIKDRRSGTIRKVALRDGDIIVMGGDFQDHFLHGIPKEPTKSGRRINVTLRQINTTFF